MPPESDWVLHAPDQLDRALLLNALAFAFRLAGNVARYGGEFGVNLYDLAIFPAIWLERVVLGTKSKKLDMLDAQRPEDSPLVEEAVDIDSFDKTLEIKEQQE